MSEKRRQYTKEFKLEAVQLALNSQSTISDTAQHLGIRPNILSRWIREYKADEEHAFPGLGNLKEPDDELRRLRKALRDAEMERDILKKALAIFSKPSH